MSGRLEESPLPTLLFAARRETIEARIVEAFKSVFDPEIPVDIYELGLIYGFELKDDGHVDVQMTLTAPACPEAGTLPGKVEDAVRDVDGVKDARVELVWEPAWTPARMSEAARLTTGMDLEY
jgi:FeS assembly SUF system protein